MVTSHLTIGSNNLIRFLLERISLLRPDPVQSGPGYQVKQFQGR